MPKKLIEIAAEMAQTQASLTPMSAADIASSLRQVFSTPPELQKAQKAGIDIEFTQPAAGATQEGPPEAKPALTPQNSIQDDKVICLECGAEMNLLTVRHLVSHGMSLKEYKQKYGFPMGTPLAAKALTKDRSKTAKNRGLPENLKKAMEARKQAKAAASTQAATKTVTGAASKPKRTRPRKKTA